MDQSHIGLPAAVDDVLSGLLCDPCFSVQWINPTSAYRPLSMMFSQDYFVILASSCSGSIPHRPTGRWINSSSTFRPLLMMFSQDYFVILASPCSGSIPHRPTGRCRFFHPGNRSKTILAVAGVKKSPTDFVDWGLIIK
ncbi:MAG TPA: hypothetical protein VKY29_06515 [Cryomorphaceae bacterium]|nr:hypothetical protein [Cryomorphaceae bacterium]